ncbi:nicotinate phosphoribosyltransferase family-domain-containing protein [Phlyctochytrium arcticum]|nr:nicotinate phosphoribosyltransferase family-domain-containing protein [Phlyctochytrium arcticum]
MSPFGIPLPLLTDSYKTTHFLLYPEAQKMVAYGEFRTGYDKDPNDRRMVIYGIRYIIENYVSKPWTMEDVDMAEAFFKTHNAGFTEFAFPRETFVKFITENNGFFPVKIEALPEGTIAYPRIPVYQITAENEYARLVTYLETILTMIWYPTTVATLSRRSRDVIEAAYEKSADPDAFWSIESRLHDFGFRGCTCVEQSIIGGCSHLLNFEGTDTMTAAFYAQYKLNGGKPVATSIPATEHSVMTAYPTEKDAIIQLLDSYGSGACACVMDSYDYVHALDVVLPSIAKHKLEKGGFLVLRPDSGDPVEVVLLGLKAIDKVFGSDVNKKGYKVVRGAGIIQGDAVTYNSLSNILKAVTEAGYSAQNVAFGMGGGLLQRVNRDTMSFATKLCKMVYKDGRERDVMKMPKTGSDKISLPGEFVVVRNEKGIPMTYPKHAQPPNTENMLRVIYDNGKISKFDDFTTIRERVKREWASLPKVFDVLSQPLKDQIERVENDIQHLS